MYKTLGVSFVIGMIMIASWWQHEQFDSLLLRWEIRITQSRNPPQIWNHRSWPPDFLFKTIRKVWCLMLGVLGTLRFRTKKILSPECEWILSISKNREWTKKYIHNICTYIHTVSHGSIPKNRRNQLIQFPYLSVIFILSTKYYIIYALRSTRYHISNSSDALSIITCASWCFLKWLNKWKIGH